MNKLKNVSVLASRVWTEEWSIDNLENPDREFSLELGQKLEIVTRNPKLILTNNNRKTRNNGEGRRETMIFVAPVRSLRYSRVRSTKTKTDV
jgi:hypothetical protein